MQKYPEACITLRGRRIPNPIEGKIALAEQRVHASAKGRVFGKLQRFRSRNCRPGSLLCLHQRLHVHLQIRDLEQRKTVLPLPKKIAGTAQSKVFFGNFEAVGGGAEGFEAFAGLLVLIGRDKNAVRLRAAAPDAPSELVELGKPEAVCVFNDHKRCVRHVDADFDDRGRHKNIGFTARESAKRRVLVRLLHFAVQKLHFHLRKLG